MEVEIKITGSGLQFESTVSLFQASQIMAFISRADQVNAVQDDDIMSGQSVTGAQDRQTLVSHSLDTQSVYESPHAAIAQTKAKVNPQKIVALAFYLGATSTNQKTFTTDEILANFKRAGESTPKNINRDFREAVAAGYIFQEDKGIYRLLSAVDNVPSEGFKKPSRKKTASGVQSPKKKLSVRDEVKQVRISTSLEGYPDYFSISNRSDQILWVIEYFKAHDIDGINRAELIDFTKKIGGEVTSKNFTASNTPNIKGSYIYIENEALKLTPKGVNKLASLLSNKEEGSNK